MTASSAAPDLITSPAPGSQGGAYLTLGFGIAVVMWALVFLCHLPFTEGATAEQIAALVPPQVTGILILLTGLAGGALTAQRTQTGVLGGLKVGAIVGLVNLLVIGGVVDRGDARATLLSAAVWVPGSVLATAILVGVGAAFGRVLLRPRRVENWLGHFAKITASATLLLIAVGGMVTGADAGLAVVDWPNTEGYLMFLYPLSQMTGGVYFEHSHRLIGSLVGLTTLVLAVYLQVRDSRPWLKNIGWIALVLVIVQGTLGGLRVTGRLTLSTDPNDTSPSIALAIIHGVLGQVFFSILIALAVVTTRAWRTLPAARPHPSVGTDRSLTGALYVGLIVQLLLGALVRHLMSQPAAVEAGWVDNLLLLHITLAVLVAIIALGAGVRAWGIYPQLPIVPRLGVGLLLLIALQLLLGVAAYIAVYGGSAVPHQATGLAVMVTTAHQTVGAALLGVTVMLLLWLQRLLTPAPLAARTTDAPATPAPGGSA